MNEDVFLTALHDDPNDEVTWLALADWLEENGQSERAELVRLVRQLRTFAVMRRTKAKATMEERVTELLLARIKPVVPQITNGIGMCLSLVPSGVFRMGSPRSERGRTHNETPHEVTLTRPFYIGIFPVTQGQYQAVMGVNPSRFRPGANEPDIADIAVERLTNFPVENVSWPDAQEFVARLSQREPLQYRLPTEAEWEYACRGGWVSTGPFPFGDSLSSYQANFNGDNPYGEAEEGPFLNRTSECGAYGLANSLGLYDMHGNVWEWTADWEESYPNHSVVDPMGPTEPAHHDRILRGGGFSDFGRGSHCRSAVRGRLGPGSRYGHVGFRAVAVWQAPASR